MEDLQRDHSTLAIVAVAWRTGLAGGPKLALPMVNAQVGDPRRLMVVTVVDPPRPQPFLVWRKHGERRRAGADRQPSPFARWP